MTFLNAEQLVGVFHNAIDAPSYLDVAKVLEEQVGESFQFPLIESIFQIAPQAVLKKYMADIERVLRRAEKSQGEYWNKEQKSELAIRLADEDNLISLRTGKRAIFQNISAILVVAYIEGLAETTRNRQ